MVQSANDPERNDHRGMCSCREWGSTRTWQSDVKRAWNLHMAEEYRKALVQIADLVHESEQEIVRLAEDPTATMLEFAQTTGVTIDKIGTVILDLDENLFDESGKL
jgi:hypothetical protein